jgi:hypothetical protein
MSKIEKGATYVGIEIIGKLARPESRAGRTTEAAAEKARSE